MTLSINTIIIIELQGDNCISVKPAYSHNYKCAYYVRIGGTKKERTNRLRKRTSIILTKKCTYILCSKLHNLPTPTCAWGHASTSVIQLREVPGNAQNYWVIFVWPKIIHLSWHDNNLL